MRRREFISLLGGAVAWPLGVRAQQPTMPVIGFLSIGWLETRREFVAAFQQGLAQMGYVDGRNVAIEYRWAEGQNDRLPALVANLVHRQVAVIAILGNTPSALAAKAATQTIPIVFLVGSDPVKIGLVASLARPGANITGVTVLQSDVAAKRLELLRELVPSAKSIALLVNPSNPVFTEVETNEMQAEARVLGVKLLILNASNQNEIDAAFATLVQQRAGALLVGSDSIFIDQRNRLVALATRYALPTSYAYREIVEIGGLMSYGADNIDTYRQVGVYISRVLRGERPADLPVQQVAKIGLTISLKTAKTLGITIPQSILFRADEMIE
jgi:putative tryptophan/tyrosine transport system substrate-binding protein